MGVKMTGLLVDSVSCELKHESNALIGTTAPKDNGGDGSLFSPTDLFVAAYGACAMTTMGLWAKRKGLAIESIQFALEKIMSLDPRRVGEIKGTISIKAQLSEEEFKEISEIAHTCPVAISLTPQLKLNIEINKIK